MKAPFPYFGGKSRVAGLVNLSLSGIDNYVEPFAGSLAVLLSKDHKYKSEIVNDIDHFLINFWRSIKYDPLGTYEHSQYPITEIDLHARHKYLVSKSDDLKSKISNIDYYDCQIAGWWIWGKCASVGNNWLQTKGLKALPAISGAGHGIQGLTANPLEHFNLLSKRLSDVTIKCEDWLSSIEIKENTGIFLDPPYDLSNRSSVYSNEADIYSDVLQWAISNENKDLKIVLCGYDGFDVPGTWKSYNWTTNGGMSNLKGAKKTGKMNASREMIYFSPACKDYK